MSEGGSSRTYWSVVGEAASRYPELWKKLPAAKRIEVPSSFMEHVQGRYLGQLAWEAYQAGVVRKPLSCASSLHACGGCRIEAATRTPSCWSDSGCKLQWVNLVVLRRLLARAV